MGLKGDESFQNDFVIEYIRKRHQLAISDANSKISS